MSRAIFDAPMTRPASSRIGDTVREMSTSRPSLVWRTVSKCSTLSPARIRPSTYVSSSSRFRRNDPGDRLPDHLGRGVAEQPLRGRVPRLNDAVQILADDRVVGRLHQRRQVQRGGRGAFLIADVAGDFRRADDAARARRGSATP